jgi:hypothetical protein
MLTSTQGKSYFQGFRDWRVELAGNGGVGLDCPGVKVWLPVNPDALSKNSQKKTL